MKNKPTTRPASKSPRRIAREALALAKQSFPAYSCRTSRKDFTQHQLFAILALKTFLKLDYRGAALVAHFPVVDAGRGTEHTGGRLCEGQSLESGRSLSRGRPAAKPVNSLPGAEFPQRLWRGPGARE